MEELLSRIIVKNPFYFEINLDAEETKRIYIGSRTFIKLSYDSRARDVRRNSHQVDNCYIHKLKFSDFEFICITETPLTNLIKAD
jgi:hypothetical protein